MLPSEHVWLPVCSVNVWVIALVISPLFIESERLPLIFILRDRSLSSFSESARSLSQCPRGRRDSFIFPEVVLLLLFTRSIWFVASSAYVEVLHKYCISSFPYYS